MNEKDIFQNLVTNKWEFALRWQDDEFELYIWKPEWVTDQLARSRACPIGKGRTVEDAYIALQEDLDELGLCLS